GGQLAPQALMSAIRYRQLRRSPDVRIGSGPGSQDRELRSERQLVGLLLRYTAAASQGRLALRWQRQDAPRTHLNRIYLTQIQSYYWSLQNYTVLKIMKTLLIALSLSLCLCARAQVAIYKYTETGTVRGDFQTYQV